MRHSSLTGQLKGSERSKNSVKSAAQNSRQSKKTSDRLFLFDRDLKVRYVAGADEAGRGCLAGPLVAAAVLFDYQAIGQSEMQELLMLDDSKAHTAKTREELYPKVLSAAKSVSVGAYSASGIDRRGLHKTNLLALQNSLKRVAIEGCICLVDGYELPDIGHRQRAVVGGDARSAAIAAASVIAKVTRDRYMWHAEDLHPGWGFADHVGYSTAEHRDAISKKGVTPLHRLSFRSVAYKQLDLIDQQGTVGGRKAA